MTTGNDLNRAKSFTEIANEIEQNGYSNLTDEEINYYIEESNKLAATDAESSARVELLNAAQNEKLQLLREQVSYSKALLDQYIEATYAKIGDNNE